MNGLTETAILTALPTAIPPGARIIQLADCTEAMLAKRSYKSCYDIDFTINQLQEGSGKQFNEKIAEVGVRLIKEGTLENLWRNVNEEELAPSIIK